MAGMGEVCVKHRLAAYRCAFACIYIRTQLGTAPMDTPFDITIWQPTPPPSPGKLDVTPAVPRLISSLNPNRLLNHHPLKWPLRAMGRRTAPSPSPPMHHPYPPWHGGSQHRQVDPDIQAFGDDRESIASWQKKNDIDPAAQVKLVGLSHMRYQHCDLDEITKFLQDFGMHVAERSEDGQRVWYRGYGTLQYVYYAQRGPKKFLGGTFEVESHAELEKAAQISGAGKIEELSEVPGQGSMITLTDPEGFPINLLHGQEPIEQGAYPFKVLVNNEVDRPRVRKLNRFTPGPRAVGDGPGRLSGRIAEWRS
ncbi:hypothetical protein LTR53_003411 [Teratosphaeriaceae sp. CCFEE 6253]|nr:hypothetical protein LTR53_003411 [Teratosphaeriaceae sp. CCFEE 6253]